MPPWAQRLLEKRQMSLEETHLSWFPLGVVWMVSEHHHFPLHARAGVSVLRGGRLCGQRCVHPCAQVCRLKQALVIALPQPGTGAHWNIAGENKGDL